MTTDQFTRPQDHLMEQMAAPANLLAAWRAVRANIPRVRRRRAHGPDGVTLDEFEANLPAYLNALRHDLLKGRYHPQPPHEVLLPKKDGGQRPIAILNISDRLAQRAAQQVLEPLWEPDFLPCSYGFRPGRSIHDAVNCARGLRSRGRGWVVDGDIANCFGSLDHVLLLKLLGQRIGDGRLMNLLQEWLAAGVLDVPSAPGPRPSIMEQVENRVRQGAAWMKGGENREDDFYRAAGYDEAGAVETDQNNRGWMLSEEDNDAWYGRTVVRQMAAGAFWLGSRWLKPGLRVVREAVIRGLQSPANRQSLGKTAALAGGAVTLAAGGAAAIWYFIQTRQGGAAPGVGVIQGSPLSPLLANIYLHPFDREMTHQQASLVRYADDWLVLCQGQEQAEEAYNAAVRSLAHLHLKIHPEKTHICPPAQRLEWLGMDL